MIKKIIKKSLKFLIFLLALLLLFTPQITLAATDCYDQSDQSTYNSSECVKYRLGLDKVDIGSVTKPVDSSSVISAIVTTVSFVTVLIILILGAFKAVSLAKAPIEKKGAELIGFVWLGIALAIVVSSAAFMDNILTALGVKVSKNIVDCTLVTDFDVAERCYQFNGETLDVGNKENVTTIYCDNYKIKYPNKKYPSVCTEKGYRD